MESKRPASVSVQRSQTLPTGASAAAPTKRGGKKKAAPAPPPTGLCVKELWGQNYFNMFWNISAKYWYLLFPLSPCCYLRLVKLYTLIFIGVWLPLWVLCFRAVFIGKAKAPTPQVTLHDRIIESEEETGSISSHNGTYSLSPHSWFLWSRLLGWFRVLGLSVSYQVNDVDRWGSKTQGNYCKILAWLPLSFKLTTEVNEVMVSWDFKGWQPCRYLKIEHEAIYASNSDPKTVWIRFWTMSLLIIVFHYLSIIEYVAALMLWWEWIFFWDRYLITKSQALVSCYWRLCLVNCLLSSH